MTEVPVLKGFTKEQLDDVVDSIKKTLSSPEMRALSQRAVQGKVWHVQPTVSAVLSELRKEEEAVRTQIMGAVSNLVYKFHEHTLDVTLARAGLLHDKRVHAGSSLDHKEEFDIFCLDAKERLYILLKSFGWLQDFFRLYPLHFYENSFQFVDRIPKKKLAVKVKVIGLGIGGSIAVSGLAKNGIVSVDGYEQRAEKGPRSVTSRYQNASWRAYDIAGELVDEEAFETLIASRQRINVTYDDGTTAVVTSDRVQIIIGAAIQSALDSARRYGADLHFCSSMEQYFIEEGGQPSKSDIVALFCGAHTSDVFPGLKEEMNVHSWPELDSTCKMWLRIQESDKKDAYCARGGEIGAEKWHYTIESARDTPVDVVRVMHNLDAQYKNSISKLEKGQDIGMTKEEMEATFQAQKSQLEKTLKAIEEGKSERFDYIFTNAPKNEYNIAKREEAAKDGTVVLDGGYKVEIKIASKSTVTSGDLLKKFNTDLVVCGGDAAVPPNPLAAYGATLACEAAGSLVQLSVAIGHVNAILIDMETMRDNVDEVWVKEVEDLKAMLAVYYEARTKSENYFQWVQTLICNMYSLPAFY
jgi:hypothetical protein